MSDKPPSYQHVDREQYRQNDAAWIVFLSWFCHFLVGAIVTIILGVAAWAYGSLALQCIKRLFRASPVFFFGLLAIQTSIIQRALEVEAIRCENRGVFIDQNGKQLTPHIECRLYQVNTNQ